MFFSSFGHKSINVGCCMSWFSFIIHFYSSRGQLCLCWGKVKQLQAWVSAHLTTHSAGFFYLSTDSQSPFQSSFLHGEKCHLNQNTQTLKSAVERCLESHFWCCCMAPSLSENSKNRRAKCSMYVRIEPSTGGCEKRIPQRARSCTWNVLSNCWIIRKTEILPSFCNYLICCIKTVRKKKKVF